MPAEREAAPWPERDRRAFVAYFASAGLSSTLFPGTLPGRRRMRFAPEWRLRSR
jgi:hypothetical protein